MAVDGGRKHSRGRHDAILVKFAVLEELWTVRQVCKYQGKNSCIGWFQNVVFLQPPGC